MKFLLAWASRQRRKPLVIRGARQVGKSTLVRQTAAVARLPLWEINLERHTIEEAVFASLDPELILREIRLRLNASGIGRGPGLLFFDEIQAAPRAIAALRYFHEQRPDLPVVAAGSLLEFTLADAGFSMPVGRVEYYFLGPLTFREFLRAVGENLLADSLMEQTDLATFSATAHDRLLDLLRQYLLVGGMPEAVAHYAETRDLSAVISVHRSILGTYTDDFSKYARGSDLERIRRIFEMLPANLGQKIRYNRFHPDWRAADIRRCLELLIRAGVAAPATHSSGNGVPIGAEEDPTVYKLFHLDVGLVGTAIGAGVIPLDAFRTGRFIHEGVLAEQFVAQQLLRSQDPAERPKLHYWQRGGSRNSAEVDFLIQREEKIVPIEVKAGTAGSLRSLHQFMLKHQTGRALRLDLNSPSEQEVRIDVMSENGMKTSHYHLRNVPLYAAELCRHISA